MKARQNKFNVKTMQKEIIEVEGKLLIIDNKSKSKAKPKNSKLKPTLREMLVEFINDINTRLDHIDTRLENIERDIKLMKNTPTMKSELK